MRKFLRYLYEILPVGGKSRIKSSGIRFDLDETEVLLIATKEDKYYKISVAELTSEQFSFLRDRK